MIITPKSYMITSLSKKNLLTECAFLDLPDKALMLTILCYSIGEFGLACTKSPLKPLILDRSKVQVANSRLLEIKEKTRVNEISSRLFAAEKMYKLPAHEIESISLYNEYAESVRLFLYNGYMNCDTDTFDLLIL